MAKFVYNGSDNRVFPTLALTIMPKQEFEAPDDFEAQDVSKVATATATKKAIPTEPTEGE